MKFDLHTFWKHENCKDVFFKPSTVFSDSNTASLIGDWCIQGIDNWWVGSYSDIIKINSENYPKWKPYTPNGRPK